MMTSALLQQWIEHPELLDGNSLEELRRLVDRFPYFQSARLLYLRNLSLLNDGGFGEELRRTAPFVADRRVLFHLIKGYPVVDSTSLSVSVEEEPSMDRTLSLIDDFLAQAPEEATAEQSVGLDYAMDYTSFLLQENESADREEEANTVPPLRGQDLIDGFIREQELARTEQPQVPLPDEPLPERSASGPDLAGENELDEKINTIKNKYSKYVRDFNIKTSDIFLLENAYNESIIKEFLSIADEYEFNSNNEEDLEIVEIAKRIGIEKLYTALQNNKR